MKKWYIHNRILALAMVLTVAAVSTAGSYPSQVKAAVGTGSNTAADNYIKEVQISNLPDQGIITLGSAFDFNRSIVSTTSGADGTIQGITRWEIKDDTAGVKSVSSKGLAIPSKIGEFKIWAVCFQSKANYKLWLSDKTKYSQYLTASSEWETINVISDDIAVARTPEQLNGVLKLSGIKKIIIASENASEFTITEGNYSGTTLVVNAAQSTVNNHGIFGSIIIDTASAMTWNEYAVGNKIIVKDSDTDMLFTNFNEIKSFTTTDQSDTFMCINQYAYAALLQQATGSATGLCVQLAGVVNARIGGGVIQSAGQPPAPPAPLTSTMVDVLVTQAASGSSITASVPISAQVAGAVDFIFTGTSSGSYLDYLGDAYASLVNQTSGSILANFSGYTLSLLSGETVKQSSSELRKTELLLAEKKSYINIPESSVSVSEIKSGDKLSAALFSSTTYTDASTNTTYTGLFEWADPDITVYETGKRIFYFYLNGNKSDLKGFGEKTVIVDSSEYLNQIKNNILSADFTHISVNDPNDDLECKTAVETLINSLKGNTTASVESQWFYNRYKQELL